MSDIGQDPLTGAVIECAITVHRKIGPGLLENAYQTCLALELIKSNISFEKEKIIPFYYDDQLVELGYRADFVIHQKLILELKCVERIMPVHEAQILTYMKIGKFKTGLILNFHEKLLKDGIKRFSL